MAQEKSPRGVIWDMDGVIADTAPFHFRAWREVALSGGKDFTAEEFKLVFGLRNDTIIGSIFGGGLTPEEVKRIAAKKEESFRKAVADNVRPVPGVMELLRSLRGDRFRMAIASSAPMDNLRLLLGALGIGDFFQAIVCGTDVSQGKPSPQGFLLAASRLDVHPEDCVVIEDAVGGVKAAKAAGMKCIAVTTTHSHQSLKEADLVVDSLEDVSADTIISLLSEKR